MERLGWCLSVDRSSSPLSAGAHTARANSLPRASREQQLVNARIRCHLNPWHTAFVGDMRHDIEAGKAARVLTIASCTGYESVAKLQSAAPDHLIANLSELPPLLAAFGAGVRG